MCLSHLCPFFTPIYFSLLYSSMYHEKKLTNLLFNYFTLKRTEPFTYGGMSPKEKRKDENKKDL